MDRTWNLNIFYQSLDDPSLAADIAALKQAVAGLGGVLDSAKASAPADGLAAVLAALEEVSNLSSRLLGYLYLRQSVEAANAALPSLQAQIRSILNEGTTAQTQMQRYIATLPELESILEDARFDEYRFYCLEAKRTFSHLLSDEAEDVLSRMQNSGSDAWSQLFDYLNATVKVDYNGSVLSLSQIRNLAYDPDQGVRKAAYKAELAAYEKVKDSIAYSLNNIKKEVTTICKLRGYASPLTMTLEQSRMQPQTLDAMFTAMKESFPSFWRYLKAKAKLLGDGDALPWYDLSAPIPAGDGAAKTYTIEEAKEYLIQVFSRFAPDSAALMEEAFDNSWIDFDPHEGKVGGAYCSDVIGHDESRILTNFSGDRESVNTLAHELGHAYHNRQMFGHSPLYGDNPAPLAETASTFNEVHFALSSLALAKDEQEELSILESFLSGTTQTICDIYSRFLFEDSVFHRCTDEFLMADQLCDIMRNAQKTAYGDGLDQNFLHPFMWCCKSHYYSAWLSYYNFPYAFGTLLAIGLYSKFQKEGEAFLPCYRALLAATPVKTLEEVGAMADIDLTTPDFWRESLAFCEKLVQRYEALVDKVLDERFTVCS